MKINELVKQYRERMGYSLRDFAIKCDMSHTMISYIENEKNSTTGKPMELSLATYKKLAYGMGLTVQQLFETLGNDMSVSLSYTEEEQMIISAWRMADDLTKAMVKRALQIE